MLPGPTRSGALNKILRTGEEGGHPCLSPRAPQPPLHYLLVDLLSRLCITERHGRQVLQNGHLHRAVPAIQQCHQGPGVHGAVHDLRTDACKQKEHKPLHPWQQLCPSIPVESTQSEGYKTSADSVLLWGHTHTHQCHPNAYGCFLRHGHIQLCAALGSFSNHRLTKVRLGNK